MTITHIFFQFGNALFFGIVSKPFQTLLALADLCDELVFGLDLQIELLGPFP